MSEPFLGQVIPVGFNFAPFGWRFCDGSLLSISEFSALFALLGTTYGGDGVSTFGLPDLRGRVVVDNGQGSGLQPYVEGQLGGVENVTLVANQFAGHSHLLMGTGSVSTPTPGPTVVFGTTENTVPLYANAGANATLSPGTVSPSTGSSQPHDNLQPYTTINYIIALEGIFPPGRKPLQQESAGDKMNPFVGQIALFPYNFAPLGWALCQGQLLPINQNTALFSLLGTQFGGNGTTNFALPDLQGRVPNGQGQGAGLQPYVIGQMAGEEGVTLTTSTLPTHSHALSAFTVTATSNAPAGQLPAAAHGGGRGGAFQINRYAASGTATTLAPGALAPLSGGNQPHNNVQPFLVLSWCIAMRGIFPSRS